MTEFRQKLLWLVLAVAAVGGVGFLALVPHVSEAPSRRDVNFLAIKSAISSAQKTVESNVKKNGRITQSGASVVNIGKTEPELQIESIYVHPDGMIVVRQNSRALFSANDLVDLPPYSWFTFIPQLSSDGAVEWRCGGYPTQALPKICR